MNFCCRQLSLTYSIFLSEPFLESTPQIHILICLLVSNDDDIPISVFISLFLSVISGGLGIAKFLKTGICKIIPRKSGYFDGLVSLGFPAVVFSIIATFVGKGLLLPVVAYRKGEGLIFSKVAMWMGLNLVPQFFYVSKYQLKARLQFSLCPFWISLLLF